MSVVDAARKGAIYRGGLLIEAHIMCKFPPRDCPDGCIWPGGPITETTNEKESVKDHGC